MAALPALMLMCATLSAGAQTAAPATKPPAESPAAAPKASRMDAQMMYEVLLSEMAALQGDPGSAASVLLGLARREKDPQLFSRAVQLAWLSRSGDLSTQAARAWMQSDPKSAPASRALLETLLNLRKVNETADPLRATIANSPTDDRPGLIASVARAYSQMPDKKASLRVLEQVLLPYTQVPASPAPANHTPGTPTKTSTSAPSKLTPDAATAAAAWSAVARLRAVNDDPTGTLTAVQNSLRLDPANSTAGGLALELMERQVAGAEPLVDSFLAAKPTPEVRMAYARVLTELDRLDPAIAQMESITKTQPDHAEAWLLLGALQLQAQRVLTAEPAFKQFLALMAKPDARIASEQTGDRTRMMAQAYVSLAQIAAGRADAAAARDWLGHLTPGSLTAYPHLLQRQALVLQQIGQTDEALALMRTLPDGNAQQQAMRAMTMARWQRDIKRPHDAYATLAQAIKQQPNEPHLLYEQAMVAEQLGRYDEMEQLLRRVIAIQPDHHHAYNALGYSMVDRHDRVAEGKALIEMALKSAPDDPYIRDSLGWAEFRLGNLPEARKILQDAFRDKPDPEIAAHLGEVLWAMGEREAALKVWREGRRLSKDNENLTATLKRLGVSL